MDPENSRIEPFVKVDTLHVRRQLHVPFGMNPAPRYGGMSVQNSTLLFVNNLGNVVTLS